ncbi:MAG: peptidylprolyl isomerase [Candidatus Bathyarchaeota archaeon]|nr:peptidylprolyl isomerase [Candidatus Bathyarchaeota archaeon]MDH5495368.1 peptidylprolyl isomerase [Candidatus Bathyarchaeota archaeon]
MPFKKGDFLLIEYTAKVKETGEAFDTTQEDVAKKERLYKEGEIYEPNLVVVGEGWVLKALDDSLSSLQLKKPETIEIPPDKAFGPRDPEKLKMVPLRRLRDKGITPKLGMRVEYEKKLATIRTVGAGRVTLDFNPPLAGKTLVYEVTAKKKLRTRKEKISALIHRRIPVVNITKFKLGIEKTDVVIRVPEEAFYIEGLQLAKRGVATDIQRFFLTITKVEFVETFKSLKATEPQKETLTKKKQTKKAKKPRKK